MEEKLEKIKKMEEKKWRKWIKNNGEIEKIEGNCTKLGKLMKN